MRYALLLLIVAATQYGYHWVEGGPAQESWTLYVMRGVQGAYLFLLLWLARPRSLVPFAATLLASACALGAFEESQNAICGVADWGNPAYVGDLCLHKFGPWPYIVLATCGLTWLITRKKP